MATIKVYDCEGMKELKCFDTLSEIPYFEDDEDIEDIPEEKNPFE